MSSFEAMLGPQTRHDMPFDFGSITPAVPIEEWDVHNEVSTSLLDLTLRSKHNVPASTHSNGAGQNAMMQLNELCQRQHIQPKFNYDEPWPGVFCASVIVGAELFSSSVTYSSKKEAKARLCAIVLEQLLRRASPANTSKHIRQLSASSSSSRSSGLRSMRTKDDQNWIGQLQEYTQASGWPNPDYRFETINTRELQKQGLVAGDQAFFCTVDIPTSHTTCKRITPPRKHFATKHAAKHAAALSAIQWLRMLQDVVSNSQNPQQTLLIEPIRDNYAGASNARHSRPASPIDEDVSLPSRVADLALSLGVSPPSYHDNTIEGDMYTYAIFLDADVRREPALTGRHGGGRGFPSKKQAKLDCCSVVLRSLAEVAAQRAGTS